MKTDVNIYEFIVNDDHHGGRLDVFVAESAGLTRNAAQKLIAERGVFLNGNVVSKNGHSLASGDLVVVEAPCAAEPDIEAEDISLDVIFEDTEIIVLNKPQGMVVHPANGHYTGTVVNALLFHCKGQLSGINGVMRPGIVHRIDKDTSGIIVCAKTNDAHLFLSKQLESHSMKRVYRGICFGSIKDSSGTVNVPISRHKTERKKMAVDFVNGKNAVTHYSVIERYEKYTCFEAVLETGRTHQIRVHMAHIGHPLLGDAVYTKRTQPFKLIGQALHAKTLGFFHPKAGEYMEFTSELPDYFKLLQNKLGRIT